MFVKLKVNRDSQGGKQFTLNSYGWKLLNILAENKDVENINKVMNVLIENNFISPNNAVLGPLIKVHLLRYIKHGFYIYLQ